MFAQRQQAGLSGGSEQRRRGTKGELLQGRQGSRESLEEVICGAEVDWADVPRAFGRPLLLDEIQARRPRTRRRAKCHDTIKDYSTPNMSPVRSIGPAMCDATRRRERSA